VWNRETLSLHRTLTGHEGPVNAIGLQNGFIVSASGDTKMMLWDIERGTCLRTFDGHDRGLACIEFKVLLFPPSQRSARPADVLSTCGTRTTTSCPVQATVQSRCGMRRQASVYAPSLDTTRLCVPLPSTLLLDALSVQAMIRLSRYGTSGLGTRCSNLSITILGISLTSSLIYIGSLGACCVA
jgi:WD40 repeat protein